MPGPLQPPRVAEAGSGRGAVAMAMPPPSRGGLRPVPPPRPAPGRSRARSAEPSGRGAVAAGAGRRRDAGLRLQAAGAAAAAGAVPALREAHAGARPRLHLRPPLLRHLPAGVPQVRLRITPRATRSVVTPRTPSSPLGYPGRAPPHCPIRGSAPRAAAWAPRHCPILRRPRGAVSGGAPERAAGCLGPVSECVVHRGADAPGPGGNAGYPGKGRGVPGGAGVLGKDVGCPGGAPGRGTAAVCPGKGCGVPRERCGAPRDASGPGKVRGARWCPGAGRGCGARPARDRRPAGAAARGPFR